MQSLEGGSPLQTHDPNLPRLVVIVGPTAVGKTEFSIRLAERFEGEIISADSRLFYRGMDIGTAKPTCEERQRVPHHLVDVADPDECWSLAVFQRAARKAIEDIHQRQKVPILVGGTGQYIRAVIEGWKPPAQEPDPKLRQVLENWAGELGCVELHRRLAVLDPDAAAKIDPRNLRRTIRALEVIFHSGRLFSVQREQVVSPYHVLMVGLRRLRPELYARIDDRIEAMLAQGFVDEVKGLLAKGFSPHLSTLSAIGYGEMIAFLEGRMSLEEAIARMKRLTRQFVRRQANWFKESDPNIHWFWMNPDPLEQVDQLVRTFLK